MNKIFFLGIAMTAFTILVSAQRQRHYDAHKSAERQTEQMKELLNLNETQYASVKQINDKYAEKADALRKEAAGERSKMRDKFQSMRRERQNELNGVLTTEQRTKWAQYQQEKKEGRSAERRSRHDHRQNEMWEALDLSEEQSQRMAAEQKAFMDNARQVRENSSLTPEARKTELKRLRDEHEAVVKGILSPDQYTKWQNMKQQQKVIHKEHQFRKRRR